MLISRHVTAAADRDKYAVSMRTRGLGDRRNVACGIFAGAKVGVVVTIQCHVAGMTNGRSARSGWRNAFIMQFYLDRSRAA